MATSGHVEQTTSDGSGIGRAQTSAKSSKTDREVATLARKVRDDTSTGDQRKTLNEWILKLREEQTAQRAERKRIAQELKNTQRRKRRLQLRARQLTNSDLMEVLLMREADKTKEDSTAAGETEVADEEDETASRTTEKRREEEKKDKSNISDDDEPRSSPGGASSMQQT